MQPKMRTYSARSFAVATKTSQGGSNGRTAETVSRAVVPTAAARKAERRLAAAREAAVNDLLATIGEHDIHAIAELVEPVFGLAVDDIDAMRRNPAARNG